MKSCECEDRPCCECGQEYLATMHDTNDRYEDEDDFVDRLMVDDAFYDRVVGWF